ncbi:hypothetical protein B0J12DRAFT_152287 [Macrophomina phaseolina]|uniref:Xylose isomerase-like TIM barrel domain-containing protein n=1 Tax=Macrophomina phaseolina TaxID=35725 RepID=A0ABQ8G543_9PEZI|nr:hypothetical protein B0J12DRAFT_152287 [Macrophomina phaseolina]
MVILFFGIDAAPPRGADEPTEAQIMVEAWDARNRLVTSGLFHPAELSHRLPDWREWAVVSAKRRTILCLNMLEWVWSLARGFPVLTCFELGPLPAPAAGYLWREGDEREWQRLYGEWLQQWKDGGYLMAEFFHIKAGKPLDVRSEAWLAEADELGVLFMAEVNCQDDLFS